MSLNARIMLTITKGTPISRKNMGGVAMGSAGLLEGKLNGNLRAVLTGEAGLAF